MNVYRVTFNEFFEADKHEYVLAENFEEAHEKAVKILKKRQRKTEDAEILEIYFEYEITEI
jgi:hypothetical protein